MSILRYRVRIMWVVKERFNVGSKRLTKGVHMCTQVRDTWLFGDGVNPKCFQSFPKSRYIMTISFEKFKSKF